MIKLSIAIAAERNLGIFYVEMSDEQGMREQEDDKNFFFHEKVKLKGMNEFDIEKLIIHNNVPWLSITLSVSAPGHLCQNQL